MSDITHYILTLVFGLISAGLLAFCRYLTKQIKDYKDMLAVRETVVLEQTIDEKLKPIQEEIKRLEKYIEEVEGTETRHITRIIASWGFRISQLCELYLEQGYMRHDQYIQLVEMFNLYTELGGNGKIKEVFLKTTNTLSVKHKS